jgi:hypothetical protein
MGGDIDGREGDKTVIKARDWVSNWRRNLGGPERRFDNTIKQQDLTLQKP